MTSVTDLIPLDRLDDWPDWLDGSLNAQSDEYGDLEFDSDDCLEFLKSKRFPDGSVCESCGRATKFHRIKGRTAYGCQYCGHHVYPMRGTIFEKSPIPLDKWFGLMLEMATAGEDELTVNRLSAEYGVTPKTVLRMRKKLLRAWLTNSLTATPNPTKGEE